MSIYLQNGATTASWRSHHEATAGASRVREIVKPPMASSSVPLLSLLCSAFGVFFCVAPAARSSPCASSPSAVVFSFWPQSPAAIACGVLKREIARAKKRKHKRLFFAPSSSPLFRIVVFLALFSISPWLALQQKKEGNKGERDAPRRLGRCRLVFGVGRHPPPKICSKFYYLRSPLCRPKWENALQRTTLLACVLFQGTGNNVWWRLVVSSCLDKKTQRGRCVYVCMRRMPFPLLFVFQKPKKGQTGEKRRGTFGSNPKQGARAKRDRG